MGDLVQSAEFGEPIAFALTAVVTPDHHGAFLRQLQKLRHLARPQGVDAQFMYQDMVPPFGRDLAKGAPL